MEQHRNVTISRHYSSLYFDVKLIRCDVLIDISLPMEMVRPEHYCVT